MNSRLHWILASPVVHITVWIGDKNPIFYNTVWRATRHVSIGINKTSGQLFIKMMSMLLQQKECLQNTVPKRVHFTVVVKALMLSYFRFLEHGIDRDSTDVAPSLSAPCHDRIKDPKTNMAKRGGNWLFRRAWHFCCPPYQVSWHSLRPGSNVIISFHGQQGWDESGYVSLDFISCACTCPSGICRARLTLAKNGCDNIQIELFSSNSWPWYSIRTAVSMDPKLKQPFELWIGTPDRTFSPFFCW